MDISKPKPVIAICEHMFNHERRCGSPAMRGTHFCYYHRQNRRHRGLEVIPDLTRHRNIQRALSNTLRGIVSGRLTYEEAGRILHGISLGMHSLKVEALKMRPQVAPGRSLPELPPPVAHPRGDS